MEPSGYLGAELKAWPVFLTRLLGSTLIAVYALSIVALTVYAVWYIASLAAFLSQGSPVPSWRPERLRVAGAHSGWPRVAVVYPVYNDYEVFASLRKALELDYPDYFVIVVDDSDDPVLPLELGEMSIRSNGRLIHLRRHGREGLKAGALNDAARLAADMGAKYMLVLDADFEPPPWLLRAMVSVAEETGADIVQGHQRHVKGSGDLFGALYRAGTAGAAVFLAGRMHLDMFPIFTGSVGLIRVSSVIETPFREGSISEDFRWTIDRALDTGGGLRVVAVHWAYADGSVPRSLHAYWRQQLRWSSGTLAETLETLPSVLLSRGMSAAAKTGYLLQGLFFTQGLWVYLSVLAPIAYRLLTGMAMPLHWLLGTYVWLIAIAAVVLAGGIGEGYSWRRLVATGVFILPMIYLSGLVHAQGTLRVLLGKGRGWVVTPKRGRYEHLYGEA